MGNVLRGVGGGGSQGGRASLERNQEQSTRSRSSSSSSGAGEGQLPPLVVLKDCGAQTAHSYLRDEFRKRSRPLLVNRVAAWGFFLGVLPYLVFCFGVAHVDYLQSLLTYAHVPTFRSDPFELQDLARNGLTAARNINLLRKDNVLLRGWHVAPMTGTSAHMSRLASLGIENNSTEINLFYDAELAKSTKPVVIYLHGNTHDRGLWYRVGLVKTLSSLGAHVIAFDYAGFGDSEGWPTEDSTYADAQAIIDWTQEALERGLSGLKDRESHKVPKLILYGHSLGSGIATHVARNLAAVAKEQGRPSPLAHVVLEAPFATFSDAIKSHPKGMLLRLLPFVQDYMYVFPFLALDLVSLGFV